MSSAKDEAVAAEQQYVARLYEHLDNRRDRAAARRAEILRNPGGTPQAVMFREEVTAKYTQEMAALTAVENGLCFGRVDLADDRARYIGRVGILDEIDGSSLLIDWRADAARDFYLATAVNPGEVYRRRHIHTRQRRVTDVHDEILDLDAPRDSWRETVTGEAALMAALGSGRTGKMKDIVSTIQAEQDRIIRGGLDGVLVVSGGPGTGKTAVALHRAAYLLYQHRERLAGRGVLILGPNSTFLNYIAEVLPGLAETDVVLRTVEDMFPGVSAQRREDPYAAAIKGDESMAEVVAVALADRQRQIDEAVHADTEYGRVWVDPAMCATARDKARGSQKPHNAARDIFDSVLLDALTQQVAQRIGADPLEEENLLSVGDLEDIRAELATEPEVRAVLDWLWPLLTPQQLLAGFLGSPRRLAAAMPGLDEEQRHLLRRESHSGWTASDVPLLDEAAELLGDIVDSAARERARAQEEARLEYAQGVLDIVSGSRSIDLEDEDDPELLVATDVLDATLLGERQTADGYLSTAERAAADRTWSFGHVVVDEAQELSPMAWRMVMRRCASRSMTVVGDLAQTSALAGVSGWGNLLQPYAAGRWREEELTISYRTPAEILDVAAETLREIDPTATPPRAVRSTGEPPWDITVAAADSRSRLAERVGAELEAIAEGRVGVIAPRTRAGTIAEWFSGWDASLDVLDVSQAKGLEFDAVIVVAPEEIVADSPRGQGDLYVALSRATRRLGIMRIVAD